MLKLPGTAAASHNPNMPSSVLDTPNCTGLVTVRACRGHGGGTAMGACCYGIASLLVPCTSLIYPLYIPCTSPVFPWVGFGSPTVSPPSPGLILTGLAWPLFKGNRIFP